MSLLRSTLGRARFVTDVFFFFLVLGAVARGHTWECGHTVISAASHPGPGSLKKRTSGPDKERKKEKDKPREGWENGTPPPHRDFKERAG